MKDPLSALTPGCIFNYCLAAPQVKERQKKTSNKTACIISGCSYQNT